MKVAVFIYWEGDDVQCVKAFTTSDAALKFAIPFVAQRVGYTLTGDDNADWDVLNTEIEHPGLAWHLQYDVLCE